MNRVVYVAAPFGAKERVRALYSALRRAGHMVAFDWTRCDDQEVPEEERKAYLSECATIDLAAAAGAQVTVVLADAGATRGAWVELGAALANGRTVILVGCDDAMIFAHHPNVVRVSTDEQAVKIVGGVP